jgi:hypothetical protein
VGLEVDGWVEVLEGKVEVWSKRKKKKGRVSAENQKKKRRM